MPYAFLPFRPVQRRTGTTINQYLTNLRVEQSKILLRDNRLKLYHIADRVGYEDAAYFARIFKTQTGMTPSEYREKKSL
ncbi:MAG: helix-turn-helix transcriptional regulator [Eisenbergiella sp.]